MTEKLWTNIYLHEDAYDWRIVTYPEDCGGSFEKVIKAGFRTKEEAKQWFTETMWRINCLQGLKSPYFYILKLSINIYR